MYLKVLPTPYCSFYRIQEELVDINARETKRTIEKLALVIFIRIWTNLFVFISLIGAGVAIYYSAIFELELVSPKISYVSIVFSSNYVFS